MVKIDNIYDAETTLVELLQEYFNPELMFSQDTVTAMTDERIAKYPEDERLACFIELKGFYVSDETKGANNMIDIEWRVYVVAPSEKYNTKLGSMLVEVIRKITGSNTKCCGRFDLINDKHQYHEPIFDTSLAYLYATFSYKGVV